MNECECDNTELRWRQTAGINGHLQYVRQCLTCGRTSSPISHSKLNKRQKGEAPEVDDSISEQYWEKRHKARKAKYVKQSNEWFKKHNAYTQSGKWKAKRAAVWRRDGYMCQACLSRPAQQVHHLTYDHWGDEPLFDLVSVCKQCHDKITQMDRARRNGEKPEPKDVDLARQEVQHD